MEVLRDVDLMSSYYVSFILYKISLHVLYLHSLCNRRNILFREVELSANGTASSENLPPSEFVGALPLPSKCLLQTGRTTKSFKQHRDVFSGRTCHLQSCLTWKRKVWEGRCSEHDEGGASLPAHVHQSFVRLKGSFLAVV